MLVLPEFLMIPAPLAASLKVEVGDWITARDLSYTFAVAWLAANDKVFEIEDQHFRVPDNPLRGALGRSRRGGIDAETSRFQRLDNAQWRTPSGLLPMPTVMFRGGIPVRNAKDGLMTWVVDHIVRNSFALNSDDPDVRVPRKLLAEAKLRATIEFYLRALAWHSLGEKAIGYTAHGPSMICVRLTPEQVIDRLGLPADLPPSRILQKYLQPIVDDLNAIGAVVEIEVRRSGTLRNPRGKVRDFTLMINLIEHSPLEEKAKAIASASRGPKAWAVKPRGPKKKRPVADISNVTVLRAENWTPIRIGLPGLGKDKMPSTPLVISQDDIDRDEIPF